MRMSAFARGATLTLFCIGCYSASMIVNGGRGSRFTPFERMFILGGVRTFALLALGAAALYARPGAPAPPPLELSLRSAAPVAVVFITNLGLLPYAMLVKEGAAVTSLAPMVGSYAVIPAAVGLMLGESRDARKLVLASADLSQPQPTN